MASALSQDQLLALAHHGARARIVELRNEIVAIEQAFPEMRPRRGRRARKQTSSQTAHAPRTASTANVESSRKPGRRGWTAAQRDAAAARMKSYWAKRKAGQKK